MRKLLAAVFAPVLLIGLIAVLVQAAPPAQGDIETAIVKGLAYLASRQQSDGSWHDFDSAGATGLVLAKFLDRAYETEKDPFETDTTKADYYQYEPNVTSGFTYLFSKAIYDSAHNLMYFNVGIEGTQKLQVYDTSIAMMAVASSRKPNAIIETGSGNGLTYRAALQDMTNWLVSAQSTVSPWTGGWPYSLGEASWADQSNSGYAVSALAMAQAPLYGFDLTIPQQTLNNLSTWITTVQATSGADAGGSLYNPTYNIGANILRTGNLLLELELVGKDAASPEVQAAVGFIQNYWGNASASDTDQAGWIGNYQSIYCLMKGMESLGIEQITVNGTQINYFDDLANYILNNEQVVNVGECYWSSPNGEPEGDPILSTAWALVTLEKNGTVPITAPSECGWQTDVVEQGRVFSYTSLKIDSDNRTHIAFGGEQLYYAVLNGSTWQEEEVDWGGVGAYCSLALDSLGNPAISYYDTVNQDLKYARWNGTKWNIETVDSTGDVGSYTSLAFDTADRPAISYFDATNNDLKYAHWNGTAWDKTTVDSGGWVGQYTSLALDSLGRPAISYYDATNENLKYAHWNGTAWNIQTVDAASGVGSYTSLAFDSSGNAGISYQDATHGDLEYAHWNGTAWNISTVDSSGWVGQYTSLAFDGSGNPAISYYDATNENLKYAHWDGTAWDIQTVDAASGVGNYSALAFDLSGNPRISYYDATNEGLKYASWNGTGWKTQWVDGDQLVGRYTSLAFDQSGNPGISYYNADAGDLDYAHWADKIWTTMTVDWAGDVGKYTSLAFDSSGNPSISYYDVTNGDLKYARWNGAIWQRYTLDSTGDVGSYSSLAFDSSGNPAISYYDATHENLKYAHWNGTAWNIQTVDAASGVGSYTSLAFDGSGNPAISYYDATNGDLKYAHWNGTSWNIETVDSAGDVGSYSSLRMDCTGKPAISYYDATNGDLKYAHWNGTSWNIEVVDSQDWTGLYTSLAFDKSDNPAISYHDATAGDLKYAHWNGKSWDIETVDSAGWAGRYTSLAFDACGAPAISYEGATNGDLKYAHPKNPPPSQPTNEAPSDNATYVSLTPVLQCSAFSDPCTDSHAASQWQIFSAPGECSNPVWDSGVDNANLVQITVPAGVLSGYTTYYWQVRHEDCHGAWSEYSDETSFTTLSPPDQPTNVSPSDKALSVGLTPKLVASAFSNPQAGDTHAASQWQITTTSGDYSSPIFDRSGTDLTQISAPSGLLTYNTTYYWHVRYEDNHSAWSNYSTETVFVTQNAPIPPSQPVNLSPSDGATGISVTPTLQSSTFSDPDAGDNHTASQWRVTTTAGDYSAPVFDSSPDAAHLTQITIPSGKLEHNTTYYWQVRYQDSQGSWSDWSTETGFSTETAAGMPPALLIAGAVIAVVILVGAGAPMMLPL